MSSWNVRRRFKARRRTVTNNRTYKSHTGFASTRVLNFRPMSICNRARTDENSQEVVGESQTREELRFVQDEKNLISAPRYRAIIHINHRVRDIHHRVTRCQAYARPIFPRARGANERCFQSGEDRRRGEEEEERRRIQRRKRGSPAVRINDVSRVHVTKEGKEDCSNGERERKII